MKGLKAFLAWSSWLGTGFLFLDELVDVKEVIKMSERDQKIIVYIVILFWIIRIAWFVYDKFYLESKERKQVMREKEEDIIDKQND